MLNRSRLAVLAGAALLPITAVGAYAAGKADQADPVTARDDLAVLVDPVGAEGRTLGLSRVRIPPHTALPLHRHPGSQIASIQRGTLTYTVREGTVEVYRGTATPTSKPVRTISAGQTGTVRRGEWVIEEPDDVHIGANRGDKPLVILLSSLFTNGSPASIVVAQ